METVNKNANFNMYYSGKDRQSGLSVSFNIWDETGSVETTNLSATEIKSGVYKATYQASNADQYLIIKGTDGQDYSSMVVQVGNPSKKVFHVDKFFNTGLTVAYVIYTLANEDLQSGNLTEILEGFYFADVSSLNTPYYFKVPPLTKIVKQ